MHKMKALLYIDHPGFEVTQQELDTALARAREKLPHDSTLIGAVATEILRGMLVAGELSDAAYRHPEDWRR